MKKDLTEDSQSLEANAEEGWTMEKAFFAEMGGFRLHTRDQRPFPIDSQQLLFLIKKGYVRLPNIENRVIQDRNKVDGLLRTLILCQILWFLVNTFCRGVQKLVITTFELTTVSFILCSAGTSFCWWHKPADVVTAETVVTDSSCAEILIAANQPLDAWKLTPLDFISRNVWWWSKAWSNFVSILLHMRLSFGSSSKPLDRFPESDPEELQSRPILVVFGLAYCFFAVLFAAWNAGFPTRVEQLLWRGACVTTMVTVSLLMLAAQLGLAYGRLEKWAQRAIESNTITHRCVHAFSTTTGLLTNRSWFQKFDNFFDCMRNNSRSKDPQMHLPLRVILSMYIIGSFYLLARAYILLADVLELRSLPASAYATVDWQRFWPHFG